MKASYSQTQTKLDLAQLIESARDAELSRDLEGLRSLLEPIWNKFDETPDFDRFEASERAELYRISGYFLSVWGASRQLKDHQERSANLLTRSIELFDECGLPHSAAKAKAILASAYYSQGRVEETEIVLDEASHFYENDQLHPVNLLIQVTKIGALIWRMDFQAAYQILLDVKIPMELCEDPFLLVRYHNQAGIIYSKIGKHTESQDHYLKAIQYGRRLNNPRYVAINHNNAASAHIRGGNLVEAGNCITKAIKLFEEIGDDGWLALSLDTEAQIYLASGDFELGLDAIERSIDLFRNGESFSLLTDAMWVKVHLLLRSDKKEEAMVLFSELSDIASREIGEYAVRKYAREFAKIVHVKKGTDYFGEVQAFKRDLLMESLVESDADINRAAKKLRTNRRELIHVLNREFPDIYLELGISPHVMSTANH